MRLALDIASWIGAIVSIVGASMVADGDRRGFYLFVVADVLLIGVQIYVHVWSQTLPLLAYLAMSIKGIVRTYGPKVTVR